MPYDEQLAARLRVIFSEYDGFETGDVVEKKMFGGIAFMLAGHMGCGVANELLMVRVGPDQYEASLAEPHVREMDFTGKPLKGFIYVEPAGIKTKRQLTKWAARSAKFIATLPPK
jgi:TfoX/Sxy family transcriptional regulator of competence genes